MRIGLQAWGSEGDIQPFTALAGGLVRAGHQVTLVVTDNAGRDYRPIADRFGFQLREVRGEILDPATEQRLWRQLINSRRKLRQARLIFQYGVVPVIEPMYEAAQELCRTNDAVLGHFFAFPLKVAAEKLGVAAGTLTVVHERIPSAHHRPPGLPNFRRWMFPFGWRLVQRAVNHIILPRVNALRQREGLPPESDVLTDTFCSSRLNLITVSPTICQPPADWGPEHCVCGFLNPPLGLSREELPPDLDEFLSAGEPPVYFTFGSMMIENPDYVREVVGIWTATVRRLGCRAVFQLPSVDRSAFPVDARLFYLSRSPYKKVFPRCSAVVHHGGAGTTQTTLLCGRPSVVVAHIADQAFWGSELERLGVAGPTQHRKRLDPTRLAKAIAMVRSRPEMTHRAERIGSIMAREDGVAHAVRLIEERLTPYDLSRAESGSGLLRQISIAPLRSRL